MATESAVAIEELNELENVMNEFAHISITKPGDKLDCVWVTIAKLVDTDVVTISGETTPLRPLPGTAGVPLETVGQILGELQRAFYYTFGDSNVDDYAKQFASSLQTTKVGVCYVRPDGSGHCVVYQQVSESSTRVSAPKTWKYVDYQTDPNGRDVEQDVANARIALLFAVEPSEGDNTAYFGRPAISSSPSDTWRAARIAEAQAYSKQQRQALIAKNRPGLANQD